MSLPANEHSPLTAPSLPAPGASPTASPSRSDNPTLPAPGATTATTAPALAANHLIDGDLPRLGSASTPLVPPTPTAATTTTTPGIDLPSLPSLPSLPTVSPVLTSPSGLAMSGDADFTPDGTHTPASVDTISEIAAEPAHPMAHLMPEKAAPSEASRKAAELRAAKKSKARKIKLGATAGMLALTILVGPPLWGWLTDAINESGSTSTEQPSD